MSAPEHTDVSTSEGKPRYHPVRAVVVLVVVLGIVGAMMTWGDLVAKNLGFSQPNPDELVDTSWLRPFLSREMPVQPTVFAFADLPQHPDRLYASYMAAQGTPNGFDEAQASVLQDFRELLHIYEVRQGIDDNFTIRVLDNRTNDVLEVYTLTEQRARYERGEWPDSLSWFDLDKDRRTATRSLVKKYEDLGVPNDAITVRWGRANQIREAREREAPFIEYEMQLAEYLGMSLLATELGTVETFNMDHLVSSVGARSRYQMMPYLLRQNRIRHYSLRTVAGTEVGVFEEWHPLLTMEPAFLLMRAYINAVGHELPGLSAYHTGPFNIFKVYQQFLSETGGDFGTRETWTPPGVLDAYVWGLTDGFEIIAANSSFKNHSRAYVPSAIGALRATEDMPIDTTQTLHLERVELQPDGRFLLSDLLATLQPIASRLDWGTALREGSLYDRFRVLNPHIDLPELSDSTAFDTAWDIRFVHEVDDARVRFFLPIGAAEYLVSAGLIGLDLSSVETYNRDRYALPTAEMTDADRDYRNLVAGIGQFGFTEANRARLNALADTFASLAARNPTPYRLRQQTIIRQHKQVWNSNRWETLAQTTASALGQARAPIQPPDPLSQ